MMTVLDEEMRRKRKDQETGQKQDHGSTTQDDMIKTTTEAVLKFGNASFFPSFIY